MGRRFVCFGSAARLDVYLLFVWADWNLCGLPRVIYFKSLFAAMHLAFHRTCIAAVSQQSEGGKNDHHYHGFYG